MDEKSGAFEEKKNKKGGKRLVKQEQTERAPREKGKGLRIAAMAAAGVLCVYLLLCCWAHFSGRIYPNVTFAGVDFGGMTRQQAAGTIEENLARAKGSVVTFCLADDLREVARIDLGDIAIADGPADIARIIYDTWGGGDSFLAGGKAFLGALISGRSVTIGSYDEAFAASAQELRAAIECDPVAFSAAVTEDGTLRITKPMQGRRVVDGDGYDPVVALLRDAYFAGAGETVLISSTAAADGVYEAIPAQDVDLASEREKLIGEKANAIYDKETGSIIPGRAGVSVSLEELTKSYESAAAGETFTVETAAVELPEVTAEELEAVLFRDTLSSYTTRVGGASGRHKNVKLTAERIDGYTMNAGETMKYGPLVTPFTKENGYYPAPGYFQGKTVDMYGGGACQASSTLYAAALYANLEIVQRVNHGFASDYIGLGLDATVAEGGPEFEFRNNTLYPLKVKAEFYTSGGKDYLKITLLGTKTDDSYVKMRVDVLETIPFEEEIVETDELAPGERKVEQTAYTGYKVKTYRNVYAGDGTLLSSTFEASSNYKARNRIVLVGKSAPETILPDGGGEPATEPDLPATDEMPDWLKGG